MTQTIVIVAVGRNHGTRMNMKKANAARTQSGTFQSAWQEPDMPMTYF
jgi:hypothetical protein